MKKDRSEKYEEFLDAAISLIEEKGFDNTSVSQIVQRAGLAQGTFYLYFSSKAALAPAIAERIVEDAMARGEKKKLNQAENSKDFLRGLIELVFEITEDYQQIITFLYSGMSYYHSLEKWEAIYDPYYQWLEKIFEQFQKKGELRKKPDTTIMVQFTLGILEQSAETCYLFKRNNGDVDKIKKDLLEFILKGFEENTTA
ncbi:TetR family transcriptional regulator [Isachenkonia alkalipeptolytica]|uniref:TetR/AcrR family transcriptional regulator n=1 Tax=Isachenkonia alkalipeptolytica TaxID=2565777 RepID=A0AA43XMX4_9CLOT|nr:TetR family transcriptional regulator [Isachenkonia alkalipeptolytica]NBG89316.1 TetR/AcrR family transcriptional regulator [Isachenkonia alkalipeptolytica]